VGAWRGVRPWKTHGGRQASPCSLHPQHKVRLRRIRYLWGASADLRRSTYGSPGPTKARNALNKDIAHVSDDSSADEDVDHPSAAPAPDAEIAYSFDAHRGPSHGSQILNVALEKAIERYEIRETDKLIKNEYEVLDADGEPLSPAKKRHIAPEDAEYEFVDA
jgi:hypothetical protein